MRSAAGPISIARAARPSRPDASSSPATTAAVPSAVAPTTWVVASNPNCRVVRFRADRRPGHRSADPAWNRPGWPGSPPYASRRRQPSTSGRLGSRRRVDQRGRQERDEQHVNGRSGTTTFHGTGNPLISFRRRSTCGKRQRSRPPLPEHPTPTPTRSPPSSAGSSAALASGGAGTYPALAKDQSLSSSRKRCAALSGVMSRCGWASSSKPTMNLRTVADRSSGG